MKQFVVDSIWARFINVVDEQAAALQRVSLTPVVRDSGDLGACLFDARGRLIAQAETGTPGHINSMMECMRYFLSEFPAEEIAPGDVLMTNDPWRASGHLLDVTIVTPIFLRDHLVAFIGSCCHTVDFGGKGFSADARSVFEEGLYVPAARLVEAGTINATLERVIRGNVRVPDLVWGDILAQISANEVGQRQLLRVLDEFGLAGVEEVADEILARSEAAMRQALSSLPDGTYRGSAITDGYDENVTIRVGVTIRGANAFVDFAGTSAASRWGINVVQNYTNAYCMYAFKCALNPDLPNNEGSFRPITVSAPPGSIVNTLRPSPVAARHIIGHFVPAAVHEALHQVVPLMADGAASIWAVQIEGEGRSGQFSTTFFTAGGTGARPDRDGLSSTAFPSGVRAVPVEVIEAGAPLVVERKVLRPDSGGPGRYRGGLGHELTIRSLSNSSMTLSAMFDRFENPARGREGGQPGSLGGMFVDGEPVSSKGRVTIPPRGRLTLLLPGGGGYGDPRQRDQQALKNDLRLGLVSNAAAHRDYGVEAHASA